MDSNFQALFTHLNPTEDQLKAILQDLWRKNDEKQKEISKIREENFAKSIEIMKMNRKVENLTNENELLKMIKTCDDVSCSVCLENFDAEEHQAYVLSCPHVICSKCLYPALEPNVPSVVSETTIRNGHPVTTSRIAPRSERLNNGHIIRDQNHPSKRCPVCREPVTTKLKKVCLRS